MSTSLPCANVRAFGCVAPYCYSSLYYSALFGVILLAFTLSCMPVAAQIAQSTEVVLESGRYQIVTDQSGEVTIEVAGYGSTVSPGDPVLPYRVYDVVLPPNANVESIHLDITLTSEAIAGEYVVHAAPGQRTDPDAPVYWGAGKRIVDGKNILTYRSDRTYPTDAVKIISESQMRKWRFVRIGFTPIQYNPVKKSLLWIKKANVRVLFNLEDIRDQKSLVLLRDREMDDVAQKRFINFENAKKWYPTPPPPPPPASDYVIVTTEQIKSNSVALADFIAHKRSLGFSPRIITELDYGTLAGLPPNGTADKIRQWLVDHYITDAVKWVLLVGDPDPSDQDSPGDYVGTVPMKMCWPDYQGEHGTGSVPTDYFYADLTGNWDLDGDQRYCEWHNPARAALHENFSVRWSGRVQLDNTGTVRFRTQSDDGVRLWIDGTLAINDWNDHGPTWNEAMVPLGAGAHDVRMEYYQHGGGAAARLLWDVGGSEAVVPSTSLYYKDASGSWVQGGLNASYYSGTSLDQWILASRIDPTVDFAWGEEDGPLSVPRAPLSIRWEGKLQVALEGDYTLRFLSDDSVRVWIDTLTGPAVLDHWAAHSPTWDTNTVHLTVGDHPLKVEFSNAAGDATARLAWSYNLAPFGNMNGDQFSVRWAGKLQADTAGVYHIRTSSDDGVRLWIDGNNLIDNWTNHAATDDKAEVTLTAGTHDIKIEYYEHGGGAAVRVFWTPPGGAEGLVPADHLLHDAGSGNYVTGGLQGNYYQWTSTADYFPTAGLKNARVDGPIDFAWGSSATGELIPGENFFHGTPPRPGLLATFYQGATFNTVAWSSVEDQIDLYSGSGDVGPNGVDFTPDVFVGRIPVYNNDYSQLDQVLRKIINYESVSMIPDWRRKLLFSSVYLWGPPGDYQIGEQLRTRFTGPLNLETYRIYESDFGLALPPECPQINPPNAAPTAPCNTVQQLANGVGFGAVGWSAHGLPRSADKLIDSGQASWLDDTKNFFTFQGSCWNGRPEDSENLGYSLLKHGAIATVSASRVSWNWVSGFQPPPNPADGMNGNLTYHYLMRVLQGVPAAAALYSTKEEVDPDAAWFNKFDFNLYGDPASSLLKPFSAAPVDVMLVVDHSGSMAESASSTRTDNKIDVLHSAADEFLDVLDGAGGNQFGLVGFSTTADTYMPLMPFTAATRGTAQAQVAVLQPTATTSIGDGLKHMVEEFSNRGMDGHRRVAMVVTDGMENTAPMISQVQSSIVAANIPVYSLGLGQAYSLDEARLTQLANDTGGDFRFTSDDLMFHKYFLEVLAGAVDWSVATDPTFTLSLGQVVSIPVRIGCGDSEALFTAYWADKDDAVRLTLRAPNGSLFDMSSPEYVGKQRYSLYRIPITGTNAALLQGTWTMDLTSQATGVVRVSASAFVRSNLRMSAVPEKLLINTGEATTLRVRLVANGQPVRGAQIVAHYERPVRSFGNVMRQYAQMPLDLKRVRPGADPITPVQAKIASVQKKLGGVLIPKQRGEILLYDDGKHGDGAANDGVYGALFQRTQIPGVYSFTYKASGLSVCGLSRGFTREWTVAVANRLRVSSQHSPLHVKQVSTSLAQVLFTPQDRIGNYLGPGHQIDLIIKGREGEQRVNLKDRLDGTYGNAAAVPVKGIDGKVLDIEIDGQRLQVPLAHR